MMQYSTLSVVCSDFVSENTVNYEELCHILFYQTQVYLQKSHMQIRLDCVRPAWTTNINSHVFIFLVQLRIMTKTVKPFSICIPW